MRVLQRSVRQLGQRTNLANGVSVVTVPSNSPVACVGVVSGCGSRHETASGQAALNNEITLENVQKMAGVSVSSAVGRESTSVFATTVPAQASAAAANLVAAVNARELSDSARSSALAKLQAGSTDKTVVTEDYLHMAAYQETPLAASPLGTTTGITESDAADVLAWRAAALAGENVVLVGTGNVDHDSLVAAAEALAPVEGLSPAKTNPCQFTGCQFTDRNDFEEDAWFRLSFQVPGNNKPRENTNFLVLKHVFGSYTPGDQHLQHSANPLIKSFCSERPIRRMEEGGATRYIFNNDILKVDGTLFSYSDTALFGYYAHVPDAYGSSKGVLDRNLRADNVNYRLMREIKRFWKGLKEHEIAAAKNRALLDFHLAQSNPLTQAATVAGQALASDGIGASNLPSLINQVNKKTIEEVVHKYIFDQEFVEAWYGCSDAANDAAANVQRSWNFLPGGQGQEFASRNAY